MKLFSDQRNDSTYRRSDGDLLNDAPDSMTLIAGHYFIQKIIYCKSILAPSGPLHQIVSNTKSLIVLDRCVASLYRNEIDKFIHGLDVEVVELALDEQSKTIEQALLLVEKAYACGLTRTGRVVGIGGGVCLDVSGFAASIFRRGVPHIKVPTTLLGLVDAGIGLKNAVNLGMKKSAVGTFWPPEACFLDSTFLTTLAKRHLSNGLAEIIKVAVVRDRDLFELLELNADELIEGRWGNRAGQTIIHKAVRGMAEELSANPFEISNYQRSMDFGHTFSPFIESASNYSLLHGEAVAIDIAISVYVAERLGLSSLSVRERTIALLRRVGLPTKLREVSTEDIVRSLSEVVAHRNGMLNLPLPTSLGACVFIRSVEEIGQRLLSEAIEELWNAA